MIRALLLIAAAAAVPAFRDVTVTMAEDATALPPGPNADVVAANCTGCHSPAMITAQPHLTEAQWRGVIDKMVGAYKAPIEDADRPAILAYLTARR